MLTPKTRSNGEKEEERVIDKWGKGRGRSRKKEIGHGWVMWIGAHGGGIGALGCGSISLVLVCYLGGAWMNKALTVAWRGRGRRSDRPDRGFNGAISLSLSLSLSVFALLWVLLSLPVSLFARLRKWFEVKITTENILHPVALILQSTLKTFSVWPNFQ